MIDKSERKAFDLTELADELERRQRSGDKRFEKYRIAIEEFEAASSILRDLHASQKSLQVLAEVENDEAARQSLGQPLFTHAVLCYCRALVSETNGRRRINVDSKVFTAELYEKHIAIKNLRSTALAHYHVGKGKFGDIWVQDRVVAMVQDGKIKANDVFLRTNFLAAALRDLNDLLETSIPYVWKERLRRRHLLEELLKAAPANDPQLLARMEDHAFDPVKFFNGRFDIESFWAGISGETETYQVPGRSF